MRDALRSDQSVLTSCPTSLPVVAIRSLLPSLERAILRGDLDALFRMSEDTKVLPQKTPGRRREDAEGAITTKPGAEC